MSESSKPNVVILGTCDTKLSELLYLRTHVIAHGANARLTDVGRHPVAHEDIDDSTVTVLSHLDQPIDLTRMDRGEVNKMMASAASRLVADLHSQEIIDGVICIGGSGGTSLGASVMRSALPIGLPKLIVSTVASGSVNSFVGETDITMMPSVVDIAGQNSILNPILENAAGMIVGAANAYSERVQKEKSEASHSSRREKKKRVAITMFGVTTPAVDAARKELEENDYEVFVFHATGVGGRAMEKQIAQGRVDGVLDLTTSELTDELVGGIMAGGPDRLSAASKMGIPQFVSLGGLEIMNFGRRASVPDNFKDRLLYEHNPDITLVRTTVQESQALGRQIAEKLKRHAVAPDMVRVYIPAGGISMISTKGGPYHDQAADQALFEAVEEGLKDSGIGVVRDERDINDSGLAKDMARALMTLFDDSGS